MPLLARAKRRAAQQQARMESKTEKWRDKVPWQVAKWATTSAWRAMRGEHTGWSASSRLAHVRGHRIPEGRDFDAMFQWQNFTVDILLEHIAADTYGLPRLEARSNIVFHMEGFISSCRGWRGAPITPKLRLWAVGVEAELA